MRTSLRWLVLGGAFVLPAAGSIVTEPVSSKLPSGALLAAAPNGVLATWERATGRLTVRHRNEILSTCSMARELEPAALALASPRRALALSVGGASITATLIDPSACRELGRVTLAAGVGRLDASGYEGEGWIVASPSGLVKLGPDLGSRKDMAASAPVSVGALTPGNPAAGEQIPALTRNGSWVFPRAVYEPRRVASGVARPVSVPACLQAAGFELRGEEFVRWAESFPKTPAASAAARETWLAAARRGDTLFMGAVTAAAADAARVGALVRVDRARACRLDVWDATTGEVRSSQPVEGTCSSALALDGADAWVANGGEWRRVALAGGPPTCP